MQARSATTFPDKFEATPPKTLQFPESLFNGLVDLLVSEELAVRRDEVSSLTAILVRVRDALQYVYGREEEFDPLPERFKHYCGVMRYHQKPSSKILAQRVEELSAQLEASRATATFTLTQSWVPYMTDVNAVVALLKVHHICCIESPIIGSVISNLELGSYCFDCAVMAGLAKGVKALPMPALNRYFAQIDWSQPSAQQQTSRSLAALMASPRPLLKIWGDDQNGKCHVCDGEEDGDPALLMCSFCNVAIHNSEACLGSVDGATVISARAASNPLAEWSCPGCWSAAIKKKGPIDGARVAGKKRPAPSARGRGGRGHGRARAGGVAVAEVCEFSVGNDCSSFKSARTRSRPST